MNLDIKDSFADFLDVTPVIELLKSEGILYVVLTIILILFAKITYHLLSNFNLKEQLTEVDNKAVALSFAGYLLGVGIVLYGVVSSPTGETNSSLHPLLQGVISTVFWGILGILLLCLARFINDKLLFSRFNNSKEIVEDRNVGTGAVEFGSFVGSAFIVYAAVYGESSGIVTSIVTCLLFFLLGQLGFWGYGLLYQAVARYDVHDEIEKDNIAAGLSFGINLIAIGWLLSNFILHSDSIVGFILWTIFASLLLICCRYVVDKLVLPGGLLDEEIVRDRNWGASLIEGMVSIVVALIATGSFFA